MRAKALAAKTPEADVLSCVFTKWVALCLTVAVGWLGAGVEAKGQPTDRSGQRDVRVRAHGIEDEDLRWAVRAHAGKVPEVETRRRIQRYHSLIRYFADLPYTGRRVSVDPNFVQALIAAESSGRPEAISEDGAVGLMQITLQTGRRAARQLYKSGRNFRHLRRGRLRNLSKKDLKDPAVNLLIGCYLLDVYNMQFGGNLGRTVAAWNAGPRSIGPDGEVPDYRETLNLIGRVNAYFLFFERSSGGISSLR